jgi:demethylmenaquinone methyltransferase/2-methoxy-6-polyprenyl-1,4-benzoquinol methylase
MIKEKFNLKLKDLDFYDPENKKYYNEKLFTEVAPKYNFLTKVLSFGRDYSWKKLLIKKLPLIKKVSCLDIACGTADITFLLAKKYSDGNITGIDLNNKMIEIAKKKNAYKNIEFKIADMCNTGLKSNSYDVITGGYALRNAPDLKKALYEINRLLKNDGRAMFLDFSKTSNKVIQIINHFFLKLWCNIWGIILHGNHEVYGYIAESLKKFPDRKKLINLLKEIGFKNIKTKKLFFGFLALVSFKK